MFFRPAIRIMNKDNDKIIGKICKRNYWTPDFQEQQKVTAVLEPHELDCKTENVSLYYKLAIMNDNSIGANKTLEDLIKLNKRIDDNVNKMIRHFSLE